MTRRILACSLASLALLAASALRAQAPPPAQVEPLTGPVVVASGQTGDHSLVNPNVAVLGQKELLVTWDLYYESYSGSQLVDWGSAISGRKVSLRGRPVGTAIPLEPFERRQRQGFHRLAADAAGRFGILWQETDSSDLLLRRFDSAGRRLGTTALEPYPGFPDFPLLHALAMDPSGRFSAAWLRNTEPHAPTDLWLQLFDAQAEPLADPIEITEKASPALAMANGITILAYLDGSTARVQRFDPAGRRLGPAAAVVGGRGLQAHLAVAANREGRFVVVWRDGQGIGARLFDPQGRKLGPVIRVTTERRREEAFPRVALDARGNFVVVWQGQVNPQGDRDARGRLFNRHGVPQGRDFVIDDTFGTFFYTDTPAVALTDAGTFLVAWPEFFFGFGEKPKILAQLYAMRRDDDRCVWRAGAFLCDTARDGNPAHKEIRFDAGAGQPLLADFDGNGLDDPCVRRGGSFLCNTTGGEEPDLELRFGTAAQTALAGDLDGDGDDDPCLREGRLFLCDTAHDGGSAEVRILLGTPTDEPLLGDFDGDGDDDPCVWQESQGNLLCDTTHDGLEDAGYSLRATGPHRPLLGDVNGDGKADFCLETPTALLCDLDRDAELTEETFATEPGDVVVLGDVDGV